jgi:hypothetical protein
VTAEGRRPGDAALVAGGLAQERLGQGPDVMAATLGERNETFEGGPRQAGSQKNLLHNDIGEKEEIVLLGLGSAV